MSGTPPSTEEHKEHKPLFPAVAAAEKFIETALQVPLENVVKEDGAPPAEHKKHEHHGPPIATAVVNAAGKVLETITTIHPEKVYKEDAK